MSSDSLAISRKNASIELSQLAEEHLNQDLQPSDRDVLRSAGSKFSTYAAFGSVVGLGLGVALAYRVRRLRIESFKAFRAMERPTHVQFADGRTEALPDLTPMLQPSTAGDIAAYLFFSAGGLFIGGELGLLTGSVSARRMITSDADRKARIENAYRRFRADVLRRELKKLEEGETDSSPVANQMWW